MQRGNPGLETIRAAIGLAQRAPSVHNSQPWRWRFDGGELDLYADRSRHLSATDPEQRALVLSCGAVLHHLRVALAALGWAGEVEHLPDPADPDHLATLRLTRKRPRGTDFGLTTAMVHRRSDRRRFACGEVPQRYVRTASDYATRFGAAVQTVPESMRPQLGKLIRTAAERHADDARYQVELAEWSGRRGTPDGVPARNVTSVRTDDQLPCRSFADPVLIDIAQSHDDAEWLIVSTDQDDRRAQLRAGESLSALLLAATDLGLATCIQTEPLGVPDLREEIRFSLCESRFPQVMIRAGWVRSSAAPLAETPRRGTDEVFAGTSF
ncbi:Acg family FMN-binding oxidoreductase [Nocardia yamanashiensis]|uniref:Acg family FMN-binding oxidoreductase n=1 Tax=Nocardia yamanashiensis TaxID=209247 RepID=UPI00082A0855|nr:nitroreductase family protein [Nocardia yamanashiensis]